MAEVRGLASALLFLIALCAAVLIVLRAKGVRGVWFFLCVLLVPLVGLFALVGIGAAVFLAH